MTNVSISRQGTHNVVYVATENDSPYAIDADSGSVLWQVSLIPTGGSTVSSTDVICSDLLPQIGITGTPVIDLGTGTIHLVTKTKENTTYVQRLHAIDITSGAEESGSPVVIQGGSGRSASMRSTLTSGLASFCRTDT